MLFIIAYWIDIHSASFMYITEVGIYKRKQETEQEKNSFFFFSWTLSWSRACFLSFFLDHFLGQVMDGKGRL